MALTTYGVNDSLTAKVWARDLNYEVTKGLEIAPLIGTGPNSIIQQKTELKSGGDRVTVGLRMQLRGPGVTEGAVLQGNEEALTTYSDNLLINELVHAVRSKGEDSIDQQRVLFDLRDEGKMAMADWWAERLSLSFFTQVCGYTGASLTYRGTAYNIDTRYTGLNAALAPSSARVSYPTSITTDQGANGDSTKTFNFDTIVKAKEKAMTANPKIRPVMVNGQPKYVMYIHPYQLVDLQLEAQATGSISWADVQLAAITGGDISGNPIYTGAAGEYNGVVLRVNEDVTTGVHSTSGAEQTSVRRAVLLGAQACLYGVSSKYDKNTPYKWVEEEFDYGRELGISAQGLFGLKKAVFNSQDFGTIVCPTYAAAHS
jgi:N4-gp56 family major capsid protein